ncbi:dnaJ homolog subfamily C member 22-like [Lineus longissimus]|uniref:dnaJ homolog subfamily C member 22-like n=1 Tax=Lineus longissimus TaxID=88925 RepID=UPI00315D4358
MAKSIVIAYILWFFLGIFGVHHFYLRRDWHAFIWWSTFGGCFGLGWLRDLVKIPQYVTDTNEGRDYMLQLRQIQEIEQRPSTNSVRILGELFTGTLYGYLVRLAVPEEYVSGPLAEERGWFSIWTLILLATPAGVALGVYIVANLGRERCALSSPLISSYCFLPFFWNDMSSYITTMAIVSTISVNWSGKKWKEGPYERHSFCKRVTVLGFCGLIYMSCWGSMLYNNVQLTSEDGEKVKLRDAIHNFFKSPAWAETKQTFSQIYEYYKIHGFQNMWDEFMKALDPEGEANAYKVLGVKKTASQTEITAAYRKLARKWHPDKEKDVEKKEAASIKFMEIQRSYEVLSKIKTRRGRKAKQSKGSGTHEEF